MAEFGSQQFSLCETDYGPKLAALAQDLIQRASVLKLDRIPDPTAIEVWYGRQRIPAHPSAGWTYDVAMNMIYLGPDLKLDPEPTGTKFSIYFDAVDF